MTYNRIFVCTLWCTVLFIIIHLAVTDAIKTLIKRSALQQFNNFQSCSIVTPSSMAGYFRGKIHGYEKHPRKFRNLHECVHGFPTLEDFCGDSRE